jgi:hypothetical protein
MALPWVRLDTAFPMNPKILALVEDKQWQAVVSYVSGLSYSGGQGTDGFLPNSSLPFVHGTPRTASQLVSTGLWIPRLGGHDINGWHEFQPSSEEHEARSARARAAAEIRWHGRTTINGYAK